LAARTKEDARFAGSAYGITAALILAPMLWELTRFRVFPATTTALVLVAFVAAASALAWKRKLTPVVWVSTLSAVLTAIALMIETRDLVPFTLALLAMAMMTEVAAWRDHWRSLRPVAAVAADFAVFVLAYVYARSDFSSSEYKPVAIGALLALPVALFVIYAGSTIVRTVVLTREITFFEVAQTIASLMLMATGVLRPTQPAVGIALGAFCLVASAGCYLTALVRFDRSSQPRNYHVFLVWAAALFLAGGFLCLSSRAQALCLGLAALAAIIAGIRWARLSLGFHGAIYLAAMAAVSGLWGYCVQMIVGASPGVPTGMAGVAVVITVLGLAIIWRNFGDHIGQQVLRLSLAAMVVCSLTALAVSTAVWLASVAGIVATSPPRLAVVRTLVICVAALALAMSGSRSKRTELVWLAYAVMALCALKLLFEDLRQGTAASLAVSLFFYGLVWVLVPRLVRARVRQSKVQE
jgi:hypothetical protein